MLKSSKIKKAIASVLYEEGYIEAFSEDELTPAKKKLEIKLKYFENKPVIKTIRRVSRPGLRVYKAHNEIKPVSGFGIAILTTPKGVISDKAAKKQMVGGEVICEVA